MRHGQRKRSKFGATHVTPICKLIIQAWRKEENASEPKEEHPQPLKRLGYSCRSSSFVPRSLGPADEPTFDDDDVCLCPVSCDGSLVECCRRVPLYLSFLTGRDSTRSSTPAVKGLWRD